MRSGSTNYAEPPSQHRDHMSGQIIPSTDNVSRDVLDVAPEHLTA